MGWVEYHSDLSPKQECDNMFGDRVVKSRMVGTTYYGAIRSDDSIVCVVILTRSRKNDYFNFMYKGMDEFCGPNAIECPKTVLDVLSETDDKTSLEWRARCRRYKKKKHILENIPLGGKIIVDGDVYTKAKYGKRNKWICLNKWVTIPETEIAKYYNFEIK